MNIKYEITPEDLRLYFKEMATGMTVHTLYSITLVALIILFMMGDIADRSRRDRFE